MKRYLLIISLLLLGSCSALAQEETTERQLGPRLPTNLNGVVTELSFAAEPESNAIKGGLAVGGTCDDNPLLQYHPTTTDCFLSFMPNLSLHRATAGSKLDLRYVPGYSLHNHLSSYDSFTQSGGIDYGYRFSPHWTIRLADGFTKTSGLSDLVSTTGQNPAFGPVQQANGSVITPIADQWQNTAAMELGYQPTSRTGLGVSGSYSILNYSNTGNTTASLVDTQTAQGNAFYTYRLSRRQTIGVSYMFQRMWFDPSSATTIQAVSYSHAIELSKYLTISFFIGPQYVNSNGITFFSGTGPTTVPIQASSWSPLAGGFVNVSRDRTAFTAGYTRRVGDGGGVYGASTITNVNAVVRQQFGKDWSIDAGGDYGTTDIVNVPVSLPIKTGTITGGVHHQFSRSFGMDVRYSWQTQNQRTIPSLYAYRNRLGITLSYSFNKLLGR
jgi:hypothetical protein